ncbi:TetR/AcrR family transcriptional regulator [Skermania sp. ID1734]|uniref:TetR/AcrR family transcriptional regulator n=1 Tax=Skermania sp. ID1734 TaxID=2597516 RepID=UPI00117F4697|nr:TetR/AcrR family transcriptional regulator [Skermania sp. ID1734]TSE00376.1 TetR/AcrR family transcriptional regulator [Skermania sp. ID1734]
MATNPTARERLVEAGLRLLEEDGPEALQARKVAAATGLSTMAVYTHFGGMTGLLAAIAAEAFARFTDCLAEVAHTGDPVADLLATGYAYRRYALANPNRYRLMFGLASPQIFESQRADITTTGSPSSEHPREPSFEVLLDVVRRMMAEGRIRPDNEYIVAGRFWSVMHGSALLEMAGFFGHSDHGLTQIVGPLTLDLLVGMGDDRERALKSMRRVRNSLTAE